MNYNKLLVEYHDKIISETKYSAKCGIKIGECEHCDSGIIDNYIKWLTKNKIEFNILSTTTPVIPDERRIELTWNDYTDKFTLLNKINKRYSYIKNKLMKEGFLLINSPIVNLNVLTRSVKGRSYFYNYKASDLSTDIFTDLKNKTTNK